MLDGFALDDVHTVVLRALQRPVATCAAPATERKDLPEPPHWGVGMGTTTSSSGVLLTAGPAAWTGDVPLVPSGSVSDELVAWIRFTATTPRSSAP